MRRHAMVFGCAIAVALALAGCAGGGDGGSATDGTTTKDADGLATTDGGQPASGSREMTVVAAVQNEIPTLDPVRSDYIQSATINMATYDRLITYDNDGEMLPMLATEFAYSDDAKSINFKLRDDVTFHDGTNLTAKDVVYTFDRIASLGIGIAGTLANYESAEAVSDYEVKLNLKEPDTLFLGSLSNVYIVNSALVEANAGSDQGQSWLMSNDAGSGPFVVSSFNPNETELTRFEDYWDYDAKRPETIIEKRVDEAATQRDEMLAGTLDIATIIRPEDMDAMRNAGITVDQFPQLGMVYIYLNNTAGKTADPVVRQALQLAYDYESSLEQFEHGNGVIATGEMPAGMACRPDDLPESKQDLDKAKQLLTDAGYENLELTLRFQPAFPEQAQEATLLQSNLAEIGVTLNLEPIAFADYLTMLQDWEQIPEMMLASASLPYPDAGVALLQGFYSKSIGTNRDAYKNADVDALIEKAMSEPDADKRCQYYYDAQVIINKDFPQMNLNQMNGRLVYRSDLTGVQASPIYAMLALSDIRVG